MPLQWHTPTAAPVSTCAVLVVKGQYCPKNQGLICVGPVRRKRKLHGTVCGLRLTFAVTVKVLGSIPMVRTKAVLAFY
jgi:hypothetical protein